MALLALTRKLIKRAEKRSPRVRKLLQEDEFTFQIVTCSGVGGHFIVHGGKLDFHFGPHPKPDFTQTWRSGNDAVRTLTSRNEAAMLRAYEEELYTMDGRFTVALRFSEIMKLARSADVC